MNRRYRFDLGRFSQDKGFWILVLIILVAFVFLQTRSVVNLVLMLASLLIAISVHECSHAWMANRLGDPTARLAGRLTLNPLAHLDPLGTIMMLFTALTGVGIGWGKPVPVATYRLKYGPRVGNGLVSVAGPAANLLAAIVFAGLARVVGLSALTPDLILLVLDSIVLINLVIAFFNLLPIPPLDGFSVLIALLSLIQQGWSRQWVQSLERLSRYGWMILLGVILLSQFTGLGLMERMVGGPAFALFDLLVGA